MERQAVDICGVLLYSVEASPRPAVPELDGRVPRARDQAPGELGVESYGAHVVCVGLQDLKGLTC